MSQWMTTIGGRDHWLDGPMVLDASNAPTIREVSHSLALINRFNGHTLRPYSVAEHSLLVCDIAVARGLPVHGQLAALLHDAHEAFTGDMATPVKWIVGQSWTGFETTQEVNTRRAFSAAQSPHSHRSAVKTCDLIALATERRDLTVHRPTENLAWPVLDTPGEVVQPWRVNLNCTFRARTPWTTWRDTFASRVYELQKACADRAAIVLGTAKGAP